jgi:hypothetical protein
MSEGLRLLCDRPRACDVDFNTSRFVVSKACGITVGDRKLELGEEVPKGVLSANALRMEYEPPLSHLELLEYIWLSDPNLREACARRGVSFDITPKPKSKVVLPDLDKLNRGELVLLCELNGLSTDGTKQQLRKSLTALLD